MWEESEQWIGRLRFDHERERWIGVSGASGTAARARAVLGVVQGTGKSEMYAHFGRPTRFLSRTGLVTSVQ